MARRRGLTAPPPSFLWTRRIVLSLLTLAAYLLVTSRRRSQGASNG